MKPVLVLLVACFACYTLAAQSVNCATSPLSKSQRNYISDVIRSQSIQKNSGTTCLPIKAHIFREDNGSGGISNEQLAIGLTFLNSVYYSAGIEFFYCGAPTYIDNSDLYQFSEVPSDMDTEADLVAATTESINAINIYYLDQIQLYDTFNQDTFDASGYAYFPSNSMQSNRVFMTVAGTVGSVNGTYNHEFGHYFSLPHTHEGTENGPSHSNAENVARSGANSNCSTHGDMFCDTEADPRSYNGVLDFINCLYTGDSMDIHGVIYNPPIDNIMSYWFDGCVTRFTPQQYTQISQGLSERQGHTAYDFTCTPATVAVPSGLTANLNAIENGVDLNWTDAANNEMGYLIEKSSTSSTAGFEVIIGGGVGDGVTTFEDIDISSNTTYWYRVKPINGDCNMYSNVATINVPVIYCSSTAGSCDEFIDLVNVGSINNISMCSASNGYSDYTSLSTNMDAGMSYPISVSLGTAGGPNSFYSGDSVWVWVDYNQNGNFESSEVTKLNANGANFSGNINVPLDAVGDSTRMRVVVRYVPFDGNPEPCGEKPYGETEDYTLVISPNCTMNEEVTVIVDSGPGSLRDAINNVCADGEITFASATDDQTITLTTGEIVINKELTIIGNGITSTTISGNNTSRIFSVSNSVELSLEEITFRDGYSVNDGGAIYNEGILNLLNVRFSNNHQGAMDKAISNTSGGSVFVEDTGTVNIRK